MKKLLVQIALVVAMVCQAAAFGTLDSTDIIFGFRGTDSETWLGTTLIELGDVNSDGFDDIAVSSKEPRGTYIFFGGDPADETPAMFLRGICTANPIDFDGDGIDDLVTSYQYRVDGIYNDHGRLLFYKGYGDSLGSEPYDSLSPDSVNYGFWGVKTGYVDDDPLGDFLVWRWKLATTGFLYYYRGKPVLDTVPDWSYIIENSQHHFGRYGFIDFDGDSTLDIFLHLRAGRDTLSFVYIFRGPEFATEPDYILGYPVEQALRHTEAWCQLEDFGLGHVGNVGDLNGDGWDDLYVDYCHHGLIYYCGPDVDTVYDVELTHRGAKAAGAGDINGDGFNDLLVNGWDIAARQSADVYLGGDPFDSTLDDYLKKSDLPIWFLDDIGRQVSAAGDFNGDGIDDFVFSCDNYAYGQPGAVFVVAGGMDIMTDVVDDEPVNVPTSSILHQSYPNPFNNSTTIEFDLPSKSQVKLAVYNVLGRKVTTLLDHELSVGTYTVQWDGSDAAGHDVSSGVYFYRLQTDESTITRKMVLMK